MNIVKLQGNISNEVAIKVDKNDSSFLHVDLLVQEENNKEILIKCVAFGKIAELINEKFSRNDSITIEGKINSFKPKNSRFENDVKMNIVINNVEL